MTQKKKAFKILFTLALSCSFSLANAQGGPGDPGPDPDGIPIDGGLSLVIAAAVGYAAKKGIEKRKRSQNEIETTEESGDTK
jgi:hypothetical protein